MGIHFYTINFIKKNPPTLNQIKRIVAKTIGFIPTSKNVLKFVFIPNAIIAIAKQKVSTSFILSTIVLGTKLNELKKATPIKNIANQGIVILLFVYLYLFLLKKA